MDCVPVVVSPEYEGRRLGGHCAGQLALLTGQPHLLQHNLRQV